MLDTISKLLKSYYLIVLIVFNYYAKLREDYDSPFFERFITR